MSLTAIPGEGFRLPWTPQDVSLTGNLNFALDAANEQCAFVFAAPAGNIRTIGFYVATVTTAPTSAHDIRLETVDATTGLPTGTLVGTNTNGSATLNSTGWKEVTLTADASPTEGTSIAIVIKAPAANFGNIRPGTVSGIVQNFPYSVTTAGSKTTLIGACGVMLDDGTVPCVGTFPVSAFTSTTWNSGSNPDRRGFRFKLPGPARLRGAGLWIDADGAFNCVFYASDGATATTLTPSPAADPDVRGSTAIGASTIRFTNPQTLAADTWYRCVLLPTSGSNIAVLRAQAGSAAWLGGLPGGVNFQWTQVNGAPANEAAWTNDDTSVLYGGLIFDQIDDGTGSGGGETSYVF